MKKFLVLLALSSVFFFGSGSYNVSAKTLKELNNDEIISYFSHYLNFDNFVLFSNDSRYFCFLPLYVEKDSVLVSETQQYYRISKNQQEVYYPDISRYNGSLTNQSIILSSIDILNVDNSSYFVKNYDYKKDTGSATVEFPYSREEFFLIPFFLAILICMLFFKWCFPMKGGKKI